MGKPTVHPQSSKSYVGNSSCSFASILKSDKTNTGTSYQALPSLVLDESCISDRDYSLSLMGKVKDITTLPNLYVILDKEGFQNLKLVYLGGLWILIEMDSIISKEKLINHTGVGSWFSSLKPTCNSFFSDERIVWIIGRTCGMGGFSGQIFIL